MCVCHVKSTPTNWSGSAGSIAMEQLTQESALSELLAGSVTLPT